uniref:Uncharacterized protein n=2 Tax=Picea TaxID=3328 RepID=A0A101LXQ7_PICGL|nr:hypothetical protein ABT39_MTgene6104 [Picea glauca]QHR92602.1 hypothetical protein Q903MT_gene6649 [Picea sitchensis]
MVSMTFGDHCGEKGGGNHLAASLCYCRVGRGQCPSKRKEIREDVVYLFLSSLRV